MLLSHFIQAPNTYKKIQTVRSLTQKGRKTQTGQLFYISAIKLAFGHLYQSCQQGEPLELVIEH